MLDTVRMLVKHITLTPAFLGTVFIKLISVAVKSRELTDNMKYVVLLEKC
jgi:hypothetical protein